jgi:dTDP-4-amino-4,6-dideoxygalactose transaminase
MSSITPALSAPTQSVAPMIPVARPALGEAEMLAVQRPIAAGWITQGPEVAAFEQEFAQTIGAPYACAVSNCTTALHLALRAVGVARGDEVITVSQSFIATANAIRYCGAVPVFIDVQAHTGNMDPEQIEPAISPRTRALLVVHQLGMPCDLQRIRAIARRRGIPVIEDAACAAGSEILWNGEWQRIGRPHGDIACFSFHPRKVITTGDGGMLTTANPDWDRQFRLWRQHAMSVSDTARHGSREVVFEAYTELGYNYRLTDVQAAIGREQLKRLPALVARRRQLAANYSRLFSGVDGVQVPIEPSWARTNWQSYAVRLAPQFTQVQVMESLLNQSISTRRGVMCAHREPAYVRELWRAAGHLTNSEQLMDTSIILPLFDQLTDADQLRVVDAFTAALSAQS